MMRFVNMFSSYVAQMFIYISFSYMTKEKNLARKSVNFTKVHQHHLLLVDKGEIVRTNVRVKAYM